MRYRRYITNRYKRYIYPAIIMSNFCAVLSLFGQMGHERPKWSVSPKV